MIDDKTKPTKEIIRACPKVLLHDHLDGGLRPQTVIELAKAEGIALPEKDPKKLSECDALLLMLLRQGWLASF